ncbi:RCC1 domain-containing protein [Paenibacillus sp. OAE614]|uniref:RCC1-like domain-containing protein n=1 Tax=Paenibacillus sp. OAE614 TaxID=2663804 RepID=UPI00339A874A
MLFLCLCIGLPSIYSFPPVQAFASSAAAPYDIQDIAAGGYHSLMLTADGTVWGWGSICCAAGPSASAPRTDRNKYLRRC